MQLRRVLSGCDVLALDEATAHAVGRLLGRSRTADIVDATVVIVAMAEQAEIVTADRDDISRLTTAAGARLVISPILG
jgi:predicted nucleic acid-binding protein